MEALRREGAPTRTLTAVIAERVKTLRTEARLSGPALATAMNERGIPWNRTTVAKLETGRRESVSVQELLALAMVLGVPPVWLLADPKARTPVPVAKGIEVDPWSALMWLTGCQPLEGPGGEGGHATAYLALSHLNTLSRLLARYHQFRRVLDLPVVSVPLPLEGDVVTGDVVAEEGVVTVLGDPDEMRRTMEAAEATTLRAVADCLGQFRALGLSVPPLPPDVRKRAAELGIEFPGQQKVAP